MPYVPESTVAPGRALSEPVLNVGEPWAEQVLADLAGLGEGWARLLCHAMSSTSAASPPARWEKTGRTLLHALYAQSDAAEDEAAVSERILSLLALVGRPRTIPP